LIKRAPEVIAIYFGVFIEEIKLKNKLLRGKRKAVVRENLRIEKKSSPKNDQYFFTVNDFKSRFNLNSFRFISSKF
jgi:hypothetical protein